MRGGEGKRRVGMDHGIPLMNVLVLPGDRREKKLPGGREGGGEEGEVSPKNSFSY